MLEPETKPPPTLPTPPSETKAVVVHPMPSLPAEVLDRILQRSFERLSPSSRYQILRSCSLVCRSWRGPAQTLLHRDVVIHAQTTAKLWTASPASERFVAERIEMDGRWGQVDAFAAEAVLTKAKPGLRRLRIDFVRGLSQRAFSLPNLSIVPFKLERLVLGGSYFPIAFIQTLFATSTDSLQNLTITMRTMHSPSLDAELSRSIATLKNLRVISDWCRSGQDFVDLCPYLPISLETINTCFPDRLKLGLLARAIVPGRLPKLKHLRLMYLTREDLVPSGVGSVDSGLIAKVCKQHGIELAFGFESASLRDEHLLSQIEALKIYY
ncbi:hypothetical protein RQP46_008353 [Phenoliferia psychrophenolica]